jgi:transposase
VQECGIALRCLGCAVEIDEQSHTTLLGRGGGLVVWQKLCSMVYDRIGNAFTGEEVSTIFTKPYSTDVLTDEQILFIAHQLPSPKATTGRPAYSNQELLPGILRVLRSGCRWRDLNLPGYPDGSTHWRRLRLWRKGLHFRWLWKRILKLLDEQNPQ